MHNKNVLTWNEAGTCVDKLAKKWNDGQEKTTYIYNPLLQLLKSQFKSTISRCPGGKPLKNIPLVHTIFFLFSFHLSLSVSVSLSVPLCHSPPLSSSSLLSVVERPFHKKRQNILFCLLRSWNDAISTSSCCYSHVFVFVQVATVLHANFQNSKISLNLYFILSVENHTLSTKIKIKGWTTEIFV